MSRFNEQTNAAIHICGIHNTTCQAALHAAVDIIVDWVEGKVLFSEVEAFLRSPGYTPSDAVNATLQLSLDFVIGKGALFCDAREKVDAVLGSL